MDTQKELDKAFEELEFRTFVKTANLLNPKQETSMVVIMSIRKKTPVGNKKRSTFHEKIDTKDKAVVLFYATWCPHSQRFLPIFEEYSKSRPNECLSIIVDDEPDICEEYSIEYYPTVIMFKKGKVHKRLDAEPGVGLNKNQLKKLSEKE